MNAGTTSSPSKKGPLATVLAALVAATIASACCLGPVVLGLLGLGGTGLFARFERFRPLFGAITLSLLALGFYLTYRKPVDDCGCEPTPRRRRARILLWLVSILTVGVLFGAPLLAGR